MLWLVYAGTNGIPARYVSGYIYDENTTINSPVIAWVDVCLDVEQCNMALALM
jgi:transglutaminase-like putative cysteine protease